MSEHTREYANPWFSVIKSGRYHWIEEAGAHHGAAILPVKNECILLLERRRAAQAGAVTMEIPRGYAKPGETSRQCAARELREETGYGVDESRLYKLGVTHPNTALIRGGVTLYLARLEHTTLHTSADAEGRITAWMPLAQLGKWLADGRLTDGFALSALAFYLGREQC